MAYGFNNDKSKASLDWNFLGETAEDSSNKRINIPSDLEWNELYVLGSKSATATSTKYRFAFHFIKDVVIRNGNSLVLQEGSSNVSGAGGATTSASSAVVLSSNVITFSAFVENQTAASISKMECWYK